MEGKLAGAFFDRLEEAIRAERPIRLVYIGRVTAEIDLPLMWENGSLGL